MFLFFLILNTIPLQLGDTITIKDWWYIGPFSIGAREGITGVDLHLEHENFKPDTTIQYPSILINGGFVKWRKIQAENDRVTIKYDDVLWDTIQDYYGVAGILCASILYKEFHCDKKMHALVQASGAGSFVLNGKVYPGDMYHTDYVQIPVILNSGINKIIIKLSGYGEHNVSFKIIPEPESLMLIKNDITMPDLIRGDNHTEAYIGIPLLNTTEKPMAGLKIEVYGDKIEKSERIISRIMPLSAVKVPLSILLKGEIEKDDSILIKLNVANNQYRASDSCWIKIKDANEPHIITFISKIDNSCQYYAVLPPKNYNPESTYALIMSCHGANVEAINQVKSYSQKDWAFIVAPTNRRRYGFDWQDWGRLDFLEVLDEAKKNFKIDNDRVYLTGHSMGGHGVWHIGLSHPDLFAAMAPSAGWTSFQLYIPWFLQKSELFAEPDQIKFRNMVLRQDITPLYLENALNLPVYILHGGADDNVPPVQARMMCHYLKNLNYDFIYNEVENQKHWWDIDTALGVDCVDLKEMMYFLREKIRNPYPKKIVFKTSDIAHANKAYYIRIDELENIYQDGRIIVTLDSTRCVNDFIIHPCLISEYNINISTENISVFTVLLREFKSVPDYFLFNINGKEYKFKYNNQDEITFYKAGNGFKIIKYNKKGLKKRANLYGPIKRAYFQPFILVYGTTGDSIDTENNLHQARLQLYNWWFRANGYTEIVPDTEITETHIKNFNLILFGNAKTNAIIQKINNKLPINFSADYICIKNKILTKENLCLMEVYPNPLNSEKLVLLYGPSTKKAQKYIDFFPVVYSGSGLPDFIIWDDTVLQYGWAGVVATGFFNKAWQVDNQLMYFK